MTEQIKIDFEKTIKASDLSEGDINLKKKFLMAKFMFLKK